jgi:hypothetical protein
MATNQILLWAPEALTTDIMALTEYTNFAIRKRGAKNLEKADSRSFNMVLKQLTTVSSAFAQFLVSMNRDVLDTHSVATIAANIRTAIDAVITPRLPDLSPYALKTYTLTPTTPIKVSGNLGAGISISLDTTWLASLQTLGATDRITLTTSQSWTVPVTSIYTVQIIAGGGGGGKGATDLYGRGGEKGGDSSFSGMVATGGSGGAGGSYHDGGGGGQAGSVLTRMVFLTKGTVAVATIGAGGAASTTLYSVYSGSSNGEGVSGGQAAVTTARGTGGQGAPGAGNGGPLLITNAAEQTYTGGIGGSGGVNGTSTSYGNGGGGGGGSGKASLEIHNHGKGGRAALGASHGGDAIGRDVSGNGGAGGKGAVIIDYRKY